MAHPEGKAMLLQVQEAVGQAVEQAMRKTEESFEAMVKDFDERLGMMKKAFDEKLQTVDKKYEEKVHELEKGIRAELQPCSEECILIFKNCET